MEIIAALSFLRMQQTTSTQRLFPFLLLPETFLLTLVIRTSKAAEILIIRIDITKRGRTCGKPD